MPLDQLAAILWWLFLISWWSAAFWVARATSTAPAARRIGYFIAFAIGFVALFATAHGVAGRAAGRLWLAPPALDIVLLAGEIACFAYAWWARIHLGRLWSGMLTLREGHRIVDTGPYALVRHPIYTGFIGASWCYALIVVRPLPLIGAAILTLVMAVKAREEEALLRRELGVAEYDAYARRTSMLIPLPRRAG